MNYFLFNKASDYQRGYGEHVVMDAGGIGTEPGFYGRAAFFSRILDSAGDGTVWHRMTGKNGGSGRGSIQISFYTSDTAEFSDGKTRWELKSLIRAQEIPMEKKKELLRPFLREKRPFAGDLLLHNLKGRYFWFLLEIYPQTEEPVRLEDFCVYFPAESWTAYLPELYRREMGNNSFLDRFLSVFQSLYDDERRRIGAVPDCLDPNLAEDEFLAWIASLLDVEDPYMWTRAQLRYVLKHAREFYGARGTRRGMELFVELYTGEKPFVVEWQDWEGCRGSSQGRLLEKLYQDDPGCFNVLVREECIPGYESRRTLLRLMEQMKPVQMELHLIVLKPYIFIDGYSYLGVNSVLGQYETAVLGGTSRLAFATMTEGEEKSKS